MSYLDDEIVPQIRKQGRLRFDFLGNLLPGDCAPTDIDNLIERNGKFLVFEYKQPGEEMPRGQEIALQKFLSLNPAKVSILEVEGIPPIEIHRYRWLAANRIWNPGEWIVADVHTVRDIARDWWDWANGNAKGGSVR